MALERLKRIRERMTGPDAAWYRMGTSTSPADIVAMLWLDGEVDHAQLERRIYERLRVHKRFRQRVVESSLGSPVLRWEEEPDSEVDSHFEVRPVPAPGGDTELTKVVNDIVNEPFAWHASPWRVYLLEGCRFGTVALARLHHCMGDGFALVRIVLSLADEKDVLATQPASAPSAHTTSGPNLRDWIRRVPHAVGSLAHVLSLSFDPPNSFRGALSGRRHFAWSKPIDLLRIRTLAHARHVTINDVLITVAAGAFRAYDQTQHDRPRPFRAIMPVNLRPLGEAQCTDGNWFGLVYVDLPLDEPDRDHRLAAVKAELDRIKASEEALVSLGMIDLMGWMPSRFEHVFQSLFARKGTVVVSNVMGPLQEFHLLGHRVRDLYFWPPHPGELACGVSILSYAGMVRIGIRSDIAIIFDPERVAELFEAELRAFEQELPRSTAAREDAQSIHRRE